MRYSQVLFGVILASAGLVYAEPTEIGTTIVGEQEAAIGLYLMPWHNDTVGDIDRPPRQVKEPLTAVDAEAFRKQVEWQQAVRDYRWISTQRKAIR